MHETVQAQARVVEDFLAGLARAGSIAEINVLAGIAHEDMLASRRRVRLPIVAAAVFVVVVAAGLLLSLAT